MSNQDLIREIAGRAWNEALREHTDALAADVARRMNGAIASRMGQAGSLAPLRDGVRMIAASRTQTEALEALLAGCSRLAPSCGLLVVRGNQATGWSCSGLTSPDNFKRAVLDCGRGAGAAVVSSASAHAGKATELDAAFLARLGLRGNEGILLLPVLLKERVAALLLALSDSQDDLAGLQILTQMTQLVLDLQSYRKAVPAPPASETQRAAEGARRSDGGESSAAPTESTQSVPAQTASASEPAEAAAASAGYASAAVAVAAPASEENDAPNAAAAPPADDTHDRARRFAKLLVEEIKLYNQAKVNEGRAHGDLYNRLREDVEKSRAVYQKRYAESVKDVDYFNQELVRILADNNRDAMGTDFPG